jgi:hypothetical protein
MLSAVFRSEASKYWIVAVATPVFDPADEKKFLGVVALTVRAARFVELAGNENQFAVLVDLREGEHRGMILQHPLFDRLLGTRDKLPKRLQEYRLVQADLPITPERMRDYDDPLAADPEGKAFDRHWLAQMERIHVRGQDLGWGVIVQEPYDTAIGSAMAKLRDGSTTYGLAAGAMVVVVLSGMWWLAFRMLHASTPLRRLGLPGQPSERSATAFASTGTAQARSQPPARTTGDEPAKPDDATGQKT